MTGQLWQGLTQLLVVQERWIVAGAAQALSVKALSSPAVPQIR